MKKIILISGMCSLHPSTQEPMYMVDQTYGEAIMAAGGIPVIACNEKIPSEYAQMADGILFTGGESVHPRYFGETFDHLANDNMETIKFLRWGCNTARDETEFALFQEFAKLGKPIMGICRGMQLVNVATGGKNDLDFPRRHPVEHNLGITHGAVAEEDSIVGQAFGKEFLVNSYHRDCAVSVGEDMRVTARSTDGIIEAIQHKEKPILGFQFHPERMRGNHPNPTFGPDGTKLFQAFVDLC